MANFGDFKGSLDYIISLLKGINRNTECVSCGGTVTTTSGNGDIPEGLNSVALVKTSASGDTVDIQLSDSSVYSLTEQGEVFVQSATGNGKLPAYSISGSGTFKWHGIK